MTTATETTAPAESDEFLTVGEVAKRLRVTPMTIYTAIHEGRLDAVRVGSRAYRVPVGAYRAFVTPQSGQLETEPTAA